MREAEDSFFSRHARVRSVVSESSGRLSARGRSGLLRFIPLSHPPYSDHSRREQRLMLLRRILLDHFTSTGSLERAATSPTARPVQKLRPSAARRCESSAVPPFRRAGIGRRGATRSRAAPSPRPHALPPAPTPYRGVAKGRPMMHRDAPVYAPRTGAEPYVSAPKAAGPSNSLFLPLRSRPGPSPPGSAGPPRKSRTRRESWRDRR